MIPNVLLTRGINVAEVCSCKVFALHELLLFLFLLVFNVLDDFLGILVDAWVASIGAFDHIDSILKKKPQMWPTAAIATKRAFQSTARSVRFFGAVVVAVADDGLLCLTGIDLGSEGLTAEITSLQGDGPDIVILRLGAKRGLEHFLKDLPLVHGSAIL